MAAIRRAPIGIVLQQFYVQAVQAARRLDVEGAFSDLLDGADACERKEKAEMVGKVGIVTDDDLAAIQVFSLKVLSIGGEDEFCTGFRRRRASLERRKGLRDRAVFSDLEVDVVGLKNPANIQFVGRAGPQALDRRGLVAERLQEREGELFHVERLLGKLGYGFFDLNGVQLAALFL